MSEQSGERQRIVAMLLAQSGIPVPQSDVEKIAEMYWSAEPARATIRSIDKGETEPMTVLAPETGDGH